MKTKWYSYVSLCLLLVTGWLVAQEPEDETKRVSENYGFLGPEIIKVGKQSGNLQVGDFDGDGLLDFMVVNLNEKKLFTFYRKPKTKELRFDKVSFGLEKRISCLRTGDLDRDGRIDIAYFDDEGKLNIMFHEKDKRSFSPPEEIDIKGNVLEIADLDNDGHNEIILLNKEEINIFFYDKERTFKKPQKYENNMKKNLGLYLADLNGDGLKDIVLVDQTAQKIAFRLQHPDGLFAPEIIQKIEGLRVGAFADLDGDKKDELLGLHSYTNALKVYQFHYPKELKKEPSTKKKFRLSQPRNYRFKTGATSRKGLTLGDVNNDNRIDLVYVDSRQAEICLYLQNKTGELGEKQTFPSFTGTRSVAIGDINNDQKNEVLVLSPDEKSIGIIHMTPQGRLSFPKPIPIEEVPTALALADMNNDHKLDLVYGARNEKSEKGFLFLMLQNDQGLLTPSQKIELTPKEGTIIEHIKLVDINNDKLIDLIVFFEITSPLIFLQKKDGTFQNVTTSNPSLKGLLHKLGPAQVTWGDVNQDKINELLISRKNFTRALTWQKDDQTEILDQYNGKLPESSIQTALVLDLDRDQIPEIILYDSHLKILTILKKESPQELFKIEANIEVDYLTLKEIFAEDLNSDGIKDLILFGQERFVIIYSNYTDPQFELLTEYNTKIKKGLYTKYATGDVNTNGQNDLAIIEAKRHNLEILTLDTKKQLSQQLTFRIFEDFRVDLLDEEGDERQWRRLSITEPKEIKIIDFNGDKKKDILLLAHRNLLIYLQE